MFHLVILNRAVRAHAAQTLRVVSRILLLIWCELWARWVSGQRQQLGSACPCPGPTPGLVQMPHAPTQWEGSSVLVLQVSEVGVGQQTGPDSVTGLALSD